MPKIAILVLLVASLAASLAACEKDVGSVSDQATTAEDEAAEADESSAASDVGYSVGRLKIIAAANVYNNPEASKPDELEKMLAAALEKTASFDDSAPELGGTITYDARTSPNIDGGTNRDVVLFGDLRRKGDDITTKYTAEVLVRDDVSESDGSYASLTKEAVTQFAEKIDAQMRIIGAGKEALIAVLESESESEKARIIAIQEIREREITGTEEILRGILDGDNDTLKVPASAALVRLGDDASRAKILELAQNFSRDRNPNFLAMIYILGDMGGEEVITYLDTVAKAHSSTAVRQVAREAVDKAVKRKAMMRGQGADPSAKPAKETAPAEQAPKAE